MVFQWSLSDNKSPPVSWTFENSPSLQSFNLYGLDFPSDFQFFQSLAEGGVLVNVLDCEMIVYEFELP